MDFDVSLIFAILNGKVFAAINRKLQRNFNRSGLGITPEQWTVLFYLSQQDMVTQQALCDMVYKDKPSMTRIIDAMERTKLVKRQANPNDRRSNLIRLTRHGRAVKERAEKIALITQRESLRGLSIADISIAQDVLRRVFDNTVEAG
ncbi:MAG: MarR family transcriptional regulator [Bacteroidaceae bacterium]|nr:MarR family transcriptional regulator [Bacteroidaceae bacterium]